MSETRLRDEICRYGESIFARGLTFGSSGNISVRLDDGWLMTPTNVALGRLDLTGHGINRASNTLQFRRMNLAARLDGFLLALTGTLLGNKPGLPFGVRVDGNNLGHDRGSPGRCGPGPLATVPPWARSRRSVRKCVNSRSR